jgi:hypothetical protein
MTDPSADRQARDDDMAGIDREAAGGLARWQKVVGLVGLVVLAALLALLLLGDHGPGRHALGGGDGQAADVEVDAGHDPFSWNQ